MAKLISKKYTNMFAAFGAFWKRGYSEWAGTSSRSEYWWSVLCVSILMPIAAFLLSLVLALPGVLAKSPVLTGGLMVIPLVLLMLVYLALFIPYISAYVRRLHDAGFSAWWVLYLYIPQIPYTIASYNPNVDSSVFAFSVMLMILGSVASIIILCLPTKVAGNPYHKNNKIK